ncbi:MULTISPECIES: hypothetical protein [unclassified Yoonia]|uniref:hypothetical protein n=1 Tax=unclassified Yoonia TaxID=2629118 RepID=UPI002AFEE525|nr:MULTISPECIES: hypothetical protein [unclassified Yoonia]
MSSGTTSRRRAVLHIGTEKTGSTSLQQLLASNRGVLRDAGVLYPLSAGSKNHTRLVAASLDDHVVDNTKAHIMAARREDEPALRSNFCTDLLREMTGGPDWHTLLLSSELIHSRLHTPTEIDRLFSYFADHVDEVHIIAVLRRQDKLAVSRFSTAIRAGHRGVDDVFEDIHAHAYVALPPHRHISDFEHYYDYAALLERFKNHVPAKNFHIWHYEDNGRRLDTASRMGSFLHVQLETSTNALSLNSSMSLTAQYIISALNAEFPSHLPSGRRNEAFRKLKRQIEEELAGPPRKIIADDAAAFLENFAASNATLASRLSRPALFESDFEVYSKSAAIFMPDDFDRTLDHYRALMLSEKPSSLFQQIKSLLRF